LGRAEWTGIETIATPNADILRVKNNGIYGRIKAIDRADCSAWCIGTMHTSHRHRTLAGFAIINCHDAPSIDAPRHFMFVFASRNASIAFNASICVTKKLHSGHFIPH
jgi:hypothetical protein